MKRRDFLIQSGVVAAILTIPGFAFTGSNLEPHIRIRFEYGARINAIYVDGESLFLPAGVTILPGETLDLDVPGTHYEIWFNEASCLRFEVNGPVEECIVIPRDLPRSDSWIQ